MRLPEPYDQAVLVLLLFASGALTGHFVTRIYDQAHLFHLQDSCGYQECWCSGLQATPEKP